MATKDVSTPGRGAMIAAVASITLAVGITVASVAGWVGRRAPSPAPAQGTGEVAGTALTTPTLMPSSVAPGWVAGPTVLVPIQPTAPAVGPQALAADPLAPAPEQAVATSADDREGRRGEGRRHEEEEDDDEDEGDDD